MEKFNIKGTSYLSKKNDSKLIFHFFFHSFHTFLSLHTVRKLKFSKSINLFVLKCNKKKVKDKVKEYVFTLPKLSLIKDSSFSDEKELKNNNNNNHKLT